MENAVGSGKISTKDDRLHRGRKVTSAFLMQGWGQFFNQAILILLLLVFHHGRSVIFAYPSAKALLTFIQVEIRRIRPLRSSGRTESPLRFQLWAHCG